MIRRALDLAIENGLDLVEVAPTARPPVCRIMDFSKYKYDQERKERRVKKSQHVAHLKQIRVKPHIDENDYLTKLKQAQAFLSKKDKVKVNLFFRGREMSFVDLGKKVMDRFVKDLGNYGQIEKSPSMEGKVMSVVVIPRTQPVDKKATAVEKGTEDAET
jgi:translation initiation factor IF-3